MSRLDVPGATLYFETQGSGPLLVVVPASSGSVDAYRVLAERLARHYTVALYDRRGFSRSYLSGAQQYERRMETDADDVRRLIEHLDAGPARVFGNSSGALVTLAVLTHHPDVVETAIAHEPPCMTVWPGGRKWIDRFHLLYDMYREVGPQPAVTQFRQEAFVQSDIATMASVMQPDKDPYVFGNATYWFERELRQYPAYPLDCDALAARAKRIVLLNGEDSRGFPCYEATAELGKRVGCDVLEVPGGHVAHLDHAPELVDALHAHLSQERNRA